GARNELCQILRRIARQGRTAGRQHFHSRQSALLAAEVGQVYFVNQVCFAIRLKSGRGHRDDYIERSVDGPRTRRARFGWFLCDCERRSEASGKPAEKRSSVNGGP